MNRWAILAGYGLLAAATQLTWLSFAPITTETARALHVGVGAAGDLAAAFPLVYILLALPTGRWLDRRFARALGAGALLTGGGALLRVADPSSFAWQLAGQAVIAAGQPLVLNAITKIVARHFPEGERATAISLGTVALFVGILAAMLTGPVLFDAGGLAAVLSVHAAVAVAGALWMLAALRTPAAYAGTEPSTTVSLRWLARDPLLWKLGGLLFVGMGIYNAVATWLQPILADFHVGGADAGNLFALMTFAGIVGAGVLPPVVAGRDRRRMMLAVAVAVTAATFGALAAAHNLAWLSVWLFVDGLVLMASLPVVLDWSELHVGQERQGAATGFLMLAGNLGGLVLVLVAQAVIHDPYLPLAALAAAAVGGLALTGTLPRRVGMVGPGAPTGPATEPQPAG